MKWTIVSLLLLGVVAAIAATVLVVTFQSGRFQVIAAPAPRIDTIDILVATRDLAAMTVVDATAVAKRTVSASEAPVEAVSDVARVIGQVCNRKVLEGQAFTTSLFLAEAAGVHLATALPEGRRAMSILLSDNSGIEGLLYPGSLVDVVASFRLPRPDGSSSHDVISTVLLQRVPVLAVGRQSIVSETLEEPEAISRRGRTVAVMVDAKQAEALQLAATYGTVTVTLRNPLDTGAMPEPGTRMSELSKDLAERLASLAAAEEEPLTAMSPAEVPYMKGDQSPASSVTTADGPLSPTGAEASASLPSIEQEPALWITTILRGRLKEVQKFPMPEEQAAPE